MSSAGAERLMRQGACLPLALAVVVVVACMPAVSAAQSYTVLPIDPLPGSSGYVWPRGINNRGTVVGSAPTATGATHAFRWTHAGGTQDLGDLPGGGDSSGAFGINDLGVIAGYATDAVGRRAVLWDGATVETPVMPVGVTSSEARAVNAQGQIAGVAETGAGRRAFVWQPSTGFQDLGVPTGYSSSDALGLNDQGQVVGVASQGEQLSAFRWSTEAGMQDLGDLPTGAHVSFGYAINDKGNAIGRGNVPEGDRAVLWRNGGAAENLEAPPGTFNSLAYGINERGHIVGDTTSLNGHKASIWFTPQGGSVDLNTLIDPLSGWSLVAAYDINDVGQIIGVGVSPLGMFGGFVLNPLPEVEGFWPNTPEVGPTVFVFGSGFVPGETQVSIGGVPCPAVQWMSGDMVIALRPPGVTSGAVVVETPFGGATAPGNYGDPGGELALSAVWPPQGSVFEFIFVFGSGFSTQGTEVLLNGTPAYATQVLDESLLIFMVPAGAVSGPVEVRVGGETAVSAAPFAIY